MNRSKKTYEPGPVTFATADAPAPDWPSTSVIEVTDDGSLSIKIADDGRGAIWVAPPGREDSASSAAASSLRALSDAQYVLQRALDAAFKAAGL